MQTVKTTDEMNAQLAQLTATKKKRKRQQQKDSQRMAERQVEMNRQTSVDFVQRLAATEQRKQETTAKHALKEQTNEIKDKERQERAEMTRRP
jgi:hypothetical protein